MRFHEQVVVLVFVLSVVGDIGSFINTAWSGNELSSQNSALLIPGADAFAKLLVNILKNAAKKKRPKKPKGGSEHTKNKRPSTKGKHEKGQARKEKEQKKANEKKQKEAKKRPGS